MAGKFLKSRGKRIPAEKPLSASQASETVAKSFGGNDGVGKNKKPAVKSQKPHLFG